MTAFRRELCVAALAAAALGLGAPARADAALKSLWSANVLADGRPAFPVFQELGVDVMQYQLRWDFVARSRPADPRNPADPGYRWPAHLDQALAASGTYGFRVALMIKGTPSWANGGQPPAWVPGNPADYADFAVAAARRYPAVRHWMVWGEPTRAANFQPLSPHSQQAPRNYAVLLDATYAALKAERRSNVVIGGMSWSGGEYLPARWLRHLRLPDGRPPRLDWYGHNPFGRYPRLRDRVHLPGVRDFGDLDRFIGEVRRHFRPRGIRPRLWLSEWTVATDRPNRAFQEHVSRAAQARWIRAAYRIADRKRWIAGLGWWKLQDEPEPNGITSGLLDANGDPKPSFAAYRRAR